MDRGPWYGWRVRSRTGACLGGACASQSARIVAQWGPAGWVPPTSPVGCPPPPPFPHPPLGAMWHHHHFHCNSIGVIRVCTAHRCWSGAFRLQIVEGHEELSGSHCQIRTVRMLPQGPRQLSVRDAGRSFGCHCFGGGGLHRQKKQKPFLPGIHLGRFGMVQNVGNSGCERATLRCESRGARIVAGAVTPPPNPAFGATKMGAPGGARPSPWAPRGRCKAGVREDGKRSMGGPGGCPWAGQPLPPWDCSPRLALPRTTDGGWRITDGGWRITDGGWRITDGGWRITDGGWRITDGGWRAGMHFLLFRREGT